MKRRDSASLSNRHTTALDKQFSSERYTLMTVSFKRKKKAFKINNANTLVCGRLHKIGPRLCPEYIYSNSNLVPRIFSTFPILRSLHFENHRPEDPGDEVDYRNKLKSPNGN